MDLGIKGKRALVFAASQGLGRAIAAALVQEGAIVAIAARNEVTLKKTAVAIGASKIIVCDLEKPLAAKAAVDEVCAAWGGIDILVTNAGGPPKGEFSKITNPEWSLGFQTLWLGVVDSVQAALPPMKTQKWGRILLVTSAAAREPMKNLTVSNGLRAGLLGLTKSLSNEIAEYGITINALLPGYTRTERLKELGIDESVMTAVIPAKRLAKPEEFGALASFLASQNAGYITGQAIACDGGYLRGI